MLCSFGEPASRFSFVALDSLFLISGGVKETKCVFGCGITVVRQRFDVGKTGGIGGCRSGIAGG